MANEVERSLSGHRASAAPSAWSYEDQEQALKEGFNSVAEWGLFHAVKQLQDHEERITAMEEAHARRGDPI